MPCPPTCNSTRGGRQDLDGVHPSFHQLRPCCNWKLGSPKPISVAALSIQMHLGRNLGVLQGKKIDSRVLYVHRIILCLNDERGRSLLRRMYVRIGREVLLRYCEITWINDHRKIRAATYFVSCINGIVQPLSEMSAKRSREVSTSRKSKHADALWIDVPLGGVRSHDTQRALRVLQGSRGFGIWPGVRHAVLEQDARDAHRIEPVAHFRAFQIDRQNAVGAARKHNDGRARVFARRRIESQRRRGNIAEANERLAGDEIFLGRRRVSFGRGVGLRSWRCMRPNVQRRMAGRRRPLRRRTRGYSEERSEQNQTVTHDEGLES